MIIMRAARLLQGPRSEGHEIREGLPQPIVTETVRKAQDERRGEQRPVEEQEEEEDLTAVAALGNGEETPNPLLTPTIHYRKPFVIRTRKRWKEQELEQELEIDYEEEVEADLEPASDTNDYTSSSDYSDDSYSQARWLTRL